jgi:Amt family ammonium transporter
VDVDGALLIGIGAGVFCYAAVQLRSRWKRVDDALDVWAVHGIGGTWGALATGLFATVAVHAAQAGGVNGLLYGNPDQVWKQFIAVSASWIYSALMTFVLLKLVGVFVGLRVEEKEEVLGLDATQHGEIAYQL